MSRSTRKSSKVRALKPVPLKQATAKAVKGGATSVSNVLKVRHDGAKNSIGN